MSSHRKNPLFFLIFRLVRSDKNRKQWYKCIKDHVKIRLYFLIIINVQWAIGLCLQHHVIPVNWMVKTIYLRVWLHLIMYLRLTTENNCKSLLFSFSLETVSPNDIIMMTDEFLLKYWISIKCMNLWSDNQLLYS